MIESTIGGIKLGPEHPVRVIAELGLCFRGDLKVAAELIKYAAQAKADFIKFEIYQLDTVLTKPYRKDETFSFGTAEHGDITANLFEVYESGYLSFDKAAELIAIIKKTGIPFFATACSKQEVDFLQEQGACAVKLSSGEIDHYPLIHHVASIGMPAFFNTGQSHFWEIIRAAEEYQAAGGREIVIMENPPGYPSPPEKTDLRRIGSLQAALGMPIGFSCQTPGRGMSMAAIGAGACAIEKPLVPDNRQPFVEYVFSENMEDFKDYVDEIRYVSLARGQARRIWPREEMGLLHRHGLVTKRDLAKGHVLTPEDVDIARPGYGIRPEHWEQAMGRALRKDLEEGRAITWDDI